MLSWFRPEETTPAALAAEFFETCHSEADLPGISREQLLSTGMPEDVVEWEARLLVASAIDFALRPKAIPEYTKLTKVDSNGTPRTPFATLFGILMELQSAYRDRWERMADQGDLQRVAWERFVERGNRYAEVASGETVGRSTRVAFVFVEYLRPASDQIRVQLLALGKALFEETTQRIISRVSSVRFKPSSS